MHGGRLQDIRGALEEEEPEHAHHNVRHIAVVRFCGPGTRHLREIVVSRVKLHGFSYVTLQNKFVILLYSVKKYFGSVVPFRYVYNFTSTSLTLKPTV